MTLPMAGPLAARRTQAVFAQVEIVAGAVRVEVVASSVALAAQLILIAGKAVIDPGIDDIDRAGSAMGCAAGPLSTPWRND